MQAHAAVLELPGVAESPRAARQLVRSEARRRGLPDHVEDTALLLTSELVTNAVLHASGTVRVAIQDGCGDDRLRIEVSDCSATLPRRRDYGFDVTTGRGVRLVISLADEWGTQRPSGVPGYAKTVWFEVDVLAPDVAPAGADGAFGGLGLAGLDVASQDPPGPGLDDRPGATDPR